MLRQITLAFATLALCGTAFAQTNISQDGQFLLGYAANLNIGDSVVNITNDGTNGAFIGATPRTLGNICANVYVFDPQEEEISCCSCLITPNGLNSLSVKNDLISNPLTPATPSSVVIKLVGSIPDVDPTGNLTICNPATVFNGTHVFPFSLFGLINQNPQGAPGSTSTGLLAWGATLEPTSTPGTYSPVQVPFLNGGGLDGFLGGGGSSSIATNCNATTCTSVQSVTGNEMGALTSVCQFIQGDGTGFGICKSCQTGALAGAKQ